MYDHERHDHDERNEIVALSRSRWGDADTTRTMRGIRLCRVRSFPRRHSCLLELPSFGVAKGTFLDLLGPSVALSLVRLRPCGRVFDAGENQLHREGQRKGNRAWARQEVSGQSHIDDRGQSP
jgi:hypothetical protein